MDDPTFLIAECLNRLKKKHDKSGIPPELPPASQLSEEQQDLMNRANRAIEALREINDGRDTGNRPTTGQMQAAEALWKAYAELANAISRRATIERAWKQQSHKADKC
jgi:cation transport regulator ChaB